jgi:hypothetical protein
MCFSFLNRKSVRATDFYSENKISWFDECVQRRLCELMRIWNTMLECMYMGVIPGSYLVAMCAAEPDMHQNCYLITVVHKLGWKKLELLKFPKS